MTERCCACGTPRDLADLLLVIEVAPPHGHRFVCRPGKPIPGPMRFCFRDAVGPWWADAIALGIPEPPLLPRPVPERPAPAPRPAAVPFRPGRLVAAGIPDEWR